MHIVKLPLNMDAEGACSRIEGPRVDVTARVDRSGPVDGTTRRSIPRTDWRWERGGPCREGRVRGTGGQGAAPRTAEGGVIRRT